MSIDRLETIARACADQDLGAWLHQAAARIAAGTPPAVALGLTRSALKARRNAILCRAADQLTGSTWARAGEIAGRLALLSRLRKPDAVDRLLIQADALKRLPRDQRNLYRLLSN